MSAALIDEAAMMPEPSDASAAEAFLAVAELCEDDVVYDVEWFENPDTGHIVNRFSRNLAAEAWLVATPLNDDGARDRGAQRVVFALAVPGEPRVSDYAPLEQRLRAELEAAKNDYAAVVV